MARKPRTAPYLTLMLREMRKMSSPVAPGFKWVYMMTTQERFSDIFTSARSNGRCPANGNFAVSHAVVRFGRAPRCHPRKLRPFLLRRIGRHFGRVLVKFRNGMSELTKSMSRLIQVLQPHRRSDECGHQVSVSESQSWRTLGPPQRGSRRGRRDRRRRRMRAVSEHFQATLIALLGADEGGLGGGVQE